MNYWAPNLTHSDILSRNFGDPISFHLTTSTHGFQSQIRNPGEAFSKRLNAALGRKPKGIWSREVMVPQKKGGRKRQDREKEKSITETPDLDRLVVTARHNLIFSESKTTDSCLMLDKSCEAFF